MGQIDDVHKAITMDAKEVGNPVYLVGDTKCELGGSHFNLAQDLSGGQVPTVDAAMAKATFATVHSAIQAQLLRSCHDLSEGGLAIAAIEMAMAGGLGISLNLDGLAGNGTGASAPMSSTEILFSESNTRFLIEVKQGQESTFEELFADAKVSFQHVGTIEAASKLTVGWGNQIVLDVDTSEAKAAWLAPLDW